jgi:Holliday junction resolvase RusA-like endonuclease
METSVQLFVSVPGPPVGKGRPRVVRHGKKTHAYTPEATARWERKAQALMREAWCGREPLDEPVVLMVHAVAARPQRLLRKRDPDGRMVRIAKPDGDNVLKAVADALVGARVLKDDVLVVDWRCVCQYAAKGEEPRVEVLLSWLGTQSVQAA